jgi:hypothetical protein
VRRASRRTRCADHPIELLVGARPAIVLHDRAPFSVSEAL